PLSRVCEKPTKRYHERVPRHRAIAAVERRSGRGLPHSAGSRRPRRALDSTRASAIPRAPNRAPGLEEPHRMELIESHPGTSSDEFKANAAHQRTLAAELKRRLAAVKQGGGADLVQRHVSRGKLFVRDRVERLLDPGSAFLELSPLAADGLYDGEAPCAGIV